MNYETVKTFNNEKLERDRYGKLIETVRQNAMDV
jgi:ABC-type transport system involved in Fe-S cluster assembly fused permease/ATPase subunit